MFNTNPARPYYLFAWSNFLAAFGGGLILGKGIEIITSPLLHSGSIVAFFVGTVFGLALLQLIPNKNSETLSRWFSLAGGLSSLILLYIFINYAKDQKLIGVSAGIFFLLLCIRFGFWFYSRVLRAAKVAGQQQRIAWVELGYYIGMIFGLIIWKFLGFDPTFSIALILDAILQFSAGFLDFKASQFTVDFSPKNPEPKLDSSNHLFSDKKVWIWKLSIAVVLLTIGCQVIIFSLISHTFSNFNSSILATFYFGAAVAALYCKKFNLQLEWKNLKNISLANAFIISYQQNKERDFLLVTIFSATCVALTIIFINSYSHAAKFFILLFIFGLAFFYEILALAILDRIGLEEKLSHSQGMITKTYGLMGICAAFAMWIFGISECSTYTFLSILGICLTLSTLLIAKRTLKNSSFTSAPSKL